jgi:hypothetical protein
MTLHELAITYVGAAVGELFGYLTIPPDEYDCDGTYHLSATAIEQGRWPGHRDMVTSRIAAEILRYAGLDGARLEDDALTCLFAVLARSAEIVLRATRRPGMIPEVEGSNVRATLRLWHFRTRRRAAFGPA